MMPPVRPRRTTIGAVSSATKTGTTIGATEDRPCFSAMTDNACVCARPGPRPRDNVWARGGDDGATIDLAVFCFELCDFDRARRSGGCRGVGQPCAGTAGIACDPGLWCELQSGRCGAADAEGVCTHAPQICPMVYMPVCACGGKTYGNDCERRRGRAQKAHNGPCGPSLRRPREEPDASKNQ